MTSPVTDTDIQLIAAGVAEARANGWVTDSPEVVAHRFSSGSSTVCPGDHTMARWNDVVAACTKTAAPPPPPPPPPIVWKVKPMYNPPINLPPCVASLDCPTGGAWTLHTDGGVASWGSAPFYGAPAGKDYFKGKHPAQLVLPNAEERAAGKKYVVVASDDPKHRYRYPE